MKCFRSGTLLDISELSLVQREKRQFVEDYIRPMVKVIDPEVYECFYVVYRSDLSEAVVCCHMDDRPATLIDVTADSPAALVIDVMREFTR